MKQPRSSFFLQASRYLKDQFQLDEITLEGLLLEARKTIFADLSMLKKALRDEDREAIKKTGHSMKGALLNLGFAELAEEAREVEYIPSVQESTHRETIKRFIKRVEILVGSL